MSPRSDLDLLDLLAEVYDYESALTPTCEWLERAGRAPADGVQPGDLVTTCTADRVWVIADLEPGGTAIVRVAGLTLGDRHMTGLYRVRLTHLERYEPEPGHREVERFTLGHFPPDNPHRHRVRCACGHTPSVESWQAHLDKYADKEEP